MSYNGSGTFVINSAGTPYVSGTVISSTAANALNSDLATGLTTAITKDGQTTPTANIPLGGFKITNLGAGTVASDAARLSQVQNSTTTTLISITGTDTITGTVSPTLTAYAIGQVFSFVVAATNTGAVTLNINSLGATAVTRTGAVALVAGDMVTGQVAIVEYDGTRFQLINGNSFTNLKASGTMGVTGATTLSSTLSTSGDATIAGHTVGRGAGAISSNLVVGSGSLTSTTAGSNNNTVIGASSGTNLTTGSGNVLIGGSNSASSATVNYETVIGFAGTGKGTTTFFACTNGGGAYQSNNATTWTQTSDRRLKKNIVDNTVGLNKITALQIRNFEYRLPEEVEELDGHCAIDVKGIQLGVISQEIQQILPDCVKTESTGVMSVDSTNLTFYLVNAVKELKLIIDAQTARITALEKA